MTLRKLITADLIKRKYFILIFQNGIYLGRGKYYDELVQNYLDYIIDRYEWKNDTYVIIHITNTISDLFLE